MNWLEHYTALIQLISAVNFAYIVTHFPSKVFGMIFDVNKLLNQKLFSYKNQVAVDVESIKVMRPIRTEDGRTNESMIVTLRHDYDEHKKKWNEKETDITDRINTAKAVKGSKCLFLNVSFFCVFTLFNIATFKIFSTNFMLVFTLLLNLFVLCYSVFLAYIMWEHKWDKLTDVQCYRQTGVAFLLIVVIALFVSGINSLAITQTGAIPIPEWLSKSVLSLCVLLPLFPCVVSVVFILFHENKITNYINDKTEPLITEQEQLHRRKVELDKMDNMFTPSSPDLGISYQITHKRD